MGRKKKEEAGETDGESGEQDEEVEDLDKLRSEHQRLTNLLQNYRTEEILKDDGRFRQELLSQLTEINKSLRGLGSLLADYFNSQVKKK